jgi:prepilin-type N-terminal cleavage/methylation domain-containing protein
MSLHFGKYRICRAKCSEASGLRRGFTLVELLIAMMITSIILAAVATLAYAMSSANSDTSDTSAKQAQVRFATLRISELVKHCKLVCEKSATDLAIWRADDNGDGLININELVYIDIGPNKDHIRLYECKNRNDAVTLSAITAVGTGWWLGYYNSSIYTKLVQACSGAQINVDVAAPNTKFVSIQFSLAENNVAHQYQINSTLSCWAGYLLNGNSVVGDDD